MILQWNEPPPELTGSLQRNITKYEVTRTPRDGRDSQAVFVLAEANATYILTDLQPGTTYDIEVKVVIDTATKGQGELAYDIGIPTLTIATGMYYNILISSYIYFLLIILISPEMCLPESYTRHDVFSFFFPSP